MTGDSAAAYASCNVHVSDGGNLNLDTDRSLRCDRDWLEPLWKNFTTTLIRFLRIAVALGLMAMGSTTACPTNPRTSGIQYEARLLRKCPNGSRSVFCVARHGHLPGPCQCFLSKDHWTRRRDVRVLFRGREAKETASQRRAKGCR